MPRNGFAFAVRVGGQIEGVGFFGGRHNGVDVLFTLGRHFVFHGEIVLGINGTVFWHQIAHVAEGGQYFKIAAQVFFNRFDFVGRFHNQQVFRHSFLAKYFCF